MFLNSRQCETNVFAWEGTLSMVCSSVPCSLGRHTEGPGASHHMANSTPADPSWEPPSPAHSPGQATRGPPWAAEHRHKKQWLKGFCGFKMQLCGVRTSATLATASQRQPTALNWRAYDTVCKKTRSHTVKPSCSQIWKSFVEKTQSQLSLSLGKENPTEEERAGTRWPSWGSPKTPRGLTMAVSSKEINNYISLETEKKKWTLSQYKNCLQNNYLKSSLRLGGE